MRTLYIEAGSPWENAYSESFNSRFRDELLDREVFIHVLEAKVLAEEYRSHYNHNSPHRRPWLPNAGGVWSTVRYYDGGYVLNEGVRIDPCTLIKAGTENGVRSAARE